MDNINFSGATVSKSQVAPANQAGVQVSAEQDFSAFMQIAKATHVPLTVSQIIPQAGGASSTGQPAIVKGEDAPEVVDLPVSVEDEAVEGEVVPMPLVPVLAETQDPELATTLRVPVQDAPLSEADTSVRDPESVPGKQDTVPSQAILPQEPDSVRPPLREGQALELGKTDPVAAVEADTKATAEVKASESSVQGADSSAPVQIRAEDGLPAGVTKDAVIRPEAAPREVQSRGPDTVPVMTSVKATPLTATPDPVVGKVAPQPGPLQVVSWSSAAADPEGSGDSSGRIDVTAFRKVDGPAMYMSANVPVEGKIIQPVTPLQSSQKRDANLKTVSISYSTAVPVAEAGFTSEAAPLAASVSPSNNNLSAPPVVSQTPVPVQEIPAQIVAHAQPGKPAAMELILAPEELGKIRIHLTPDGDNMRVVIQAERPEAMELIRRNIEALSAELRQSGFASTSFSFEGWAGDAEGRQVKKSTVAIENTMDIAPDEATLNQPTNSMQSSAGLDLRV
ncbi:hypothetical protein EOK75_05720 [Pseudorhodobacter turbinis]|uniref:Flagellar hook-length control protein-like C-terminal domain-containing protein n=1 Tax=Pseudorhodobacter turbinis TaxID=2500533 RepID=A0A4P8EEQ6_9RHOB|nr:flagellar hook-length control protein FliK [Pseudorhodobacter turbinis]QCO55316.1 hypothetical protein EOK75_05720 [Pseudorhodobacter turbinis]